MASVEQLPSNVKDEAKAYLSEKEIPQLFESLTAGLLHHKPEDPVLFVQECLAELRTNKTLKIQWNSFIEWKAPSTVSRPPSRPAGAVQQS